VVVDLPAQSGRPLERWIESADVVRFARDSGIRLTLWHVSDGSFDSVRDLERTLDRWGDALSYVAVKNRGRAKDFSLFDESVARTRIQHLGGSVIEVPELDAVSMARIDRTGASFWGAIHDASGEHALAPLQRERVRLWLVRCYEAFASVGGRPVQAVQQGLIAAPAEQVVMNGSAE
jgi:hypothetical protein